MRKLVGFNVSLTLPFFFFSFLFSFFFFFFSGAPCCAVQSQGTTGTLAQYIPYAPADDQRHGQRRVGPLGLPPFRVVYSQATVSRRMLSPVGTSGATASEACCHSRSTLPLYGPAVTVRPCCH